MSSTSNSIIKIFWPIELNDLWSEKICSPKMIVWSGAIFILRWSCFVSFNCFTLCICSTILCRWWFWKVCPSFGRISQIFQGTSKHLWSTEKQQIEHNTTLWKRGLLYLLYIVNLQVIFLEILGLGSFCCREFSRSSLVNDQEHKVLVVDAKGRGRSPKNRRKKLCWGSAA